MKQLMIEKETFTGVVSSPLQYDNIVANGKNA